MNMQHTLTGLALLLGAATFNANATLTGPYMGAGNVGLVYSSVSDVTWTQDANLFKTLFDADNSLINQIADVTPSYNDSNFGIRTIGTTDFNTTNGRMTWWGGIAFANYLSSVNYGGSSQWRLPSIGSNPPHGYNQTSSEQGQLYFSELGALAYQADNGLYGILGDGTYMTTGPVGPFVNAQTYGYWSSTEYAPFLDWAWIFDSGIGYQDGTAKDFQNYAWVVSTGQVPEVPVPGAVWLMGTGLLGLLSLRRRRHTR